MNTKTKRITHLLSTGLLMAGLGLSLASPVRAQDDAPVATPEVVVTEVPTPEVETRDQIPSRDLIPESAEVNGGIEFKLSEASGVYTVYMRPNATPGNPNASVSAQVTVKVPHGSAAPSEITSLVAGTSWQQTSRIEAPAEAPTWDYLSFSLDFPNGDFKAMNWAAGAAVPAFSFKTGAGGHLMDSCDAFAAPNSRSASVGNEATVLGLGAEGKSVFIGNYEQATDCPTDAAAKSKVSLSASTSSASVVKIGSLIYYTFKLSNSGLRAASDLKLSVSLTGQAEMQSASNSFDVANPVLAPNGAATWYLGSLSPNANGTVTLVLTAPANNDTLTLKINISASNDNDATDNEAQIVTTVLVSPRPNYATYLPLITR